MKRRALLGAGSAAVLAAPALVRAAPPPRDLLVQAMAFDDVLSLDPAESFEVASSEVLGNTCERLLRFDLDDPSRLVGVLARDWRLGADGRSYRFELAEGLRFASGNALTAEDVVFSLARAVRLDKAPAFILNQLGLSKDRLGSALAQDGPLALSLQTSEAFAPSFVLNCLTAIVASVLDKRLLLAHEVDGDLGHAWARRSHAGSGPFALRDWRANEILTLDRNEHFHGPRPALARVIYWHVKEATSQRLMLVKGDVDVARNLTPQDLDALAGAPELRITATPKGGLYYIGLNQKNPVLAKPEVREALKWLVDYDALGATLIRHIGRPWQNFLPQGIFGASLAAPFHQDIARARALLGKAGVPDGFELTMDVRSTQPDQGMAEAFQQWAARAGLRISLLPGDGKQTLTRYRARKHDLYLGDWSVDYWDPQSNAGAFAYNIDNSEHPATKPLAWRNAWDIPGLSHETLAALMERDDERRRADYERLQDEFRRSAPFVILCQQTQVAALRREVQGYRLGPTSDTNGLAPVSKLGGGVA
ncbi:MAG: ABC transporter substrate-binding protein [Pelomonas sp.]|nr:ABC transporter substrate-binding protein [Roseateles sp.]MBV8604655.1 ABC transporter substrate-binding protein [Roseateles sp.]